jgi:5-formyltetrahydrofolate cyclo-ligase
VSSADSEEALLRQQVKEELRSRMQRVRRAVPPEARAARTERVCERVMSLPELESTKLLLAFSAIRAEVDPRSIIEAARQRGIAIALPRVDKAQGMLAVHHVEAHDTLQLGSFGIPEPRPDAPTVDLQTVDFVLVPGLALDERGHRIGYGKGYYDRLLPLMPAATRCAIAYDFQLIAEVPIQAGDEPVDVVVTDARVIRPPRADSPVQGGAAV